MSIFNEYIMLFNEYILYTEITRNYEILKHII